MKKLRYHITINAPIAKVYDFMLGLTNRSTYEQWTSIFNPTSTFEGSWEKGSKILFVGIDENGRKGGMVSKIVENTPSQFVSIMHVGMLVGGEEVISGPEVEKWTGGLENYSFAETMGNTTLTVELDTTEDFLDYMNESYPKALDKLKVLCEN
jgi:hypothetical protein